MMYVWIALGSALGGAARYGISGLVARHVGETFPWGTIVVNVSGCFAIGLFAAITSTEGRFLVSPAVRQFVMLGLCGGYTTFSSFGLQTWNLIETGEAWRASLNVIVSVAACLLATVVGVAAGRSLN